MIKYFEFENDIEKIEKILSQLNDNKVLNHDKIIKLDKEKDQLYKKIYSDLDPWQKVQVSRHGERPHTLDYIQNMFEDVVETLGPWLYVIDVKWRCIFGNFNLVTLRTCDTSHFAHYGWKKFEKKFEK